MTCFRALFGGGRARAGALEHFFALVERGQGALEHFFVVVDR